MSLHFLACGLLCALDDELLRHGVDDDVDRVERHVGDALEARYAEDVAGRGVDGVDTAVVLGVQQVLDHCLAD